MHHELKTYRSATNFDIVQRRINNAVAKTLDAYKTLGFREVAHICNRVRRARGLHTEMIDGEPAASYLEHCIPLEGNEMAVGGYHSQENVHGFFQPGSVDAYDICNVVSQAVFEDPNLSPDVPGLIAVVSLGSVLFAIAGKRQQVNYLRNGYLLLDTAQITDAWTQFRPTICEQIARKLGAVLAHSIDRVGDLVLSLAGIGGVSWPRTPSPIVFHAAPEVIGIDMYAASERFLKRLQYLPLQGDIANFQSFHFGNAVQDIIDASSWRPSDELRALVGEQERG